jgi:hypothetical protein
LATTDGKMCGESLIKFDASNAPGLVATNWQSGSLASDYFYGGNIEYDHKKHESSGPRGM